MVAIEDALLIAECSLEGEWEGQIHYLSLAIECPENSDKAGGAIRKLEINN